MWKLLVLGCTLTLSACATTPPEDPLDRIVQHAMDHRVRNLIEECTPRTGTRLAQRTCLKQHGMQVRSYGPNGTYPLSSFWRDPMISLVP